MRIAFFVSVMLAVVTGVTFSGVKLAPRLLRAQDPIPIEEALQKPGVAEERKPVTDLQERLDAALPALSATPTARFTINLAQGDLGIQFYEDGAKFGVCKEGKGIHIYSPSLARGGETSVYVELKEGGVVGCTAGKDHAEFECHGQYRLLKDDQMVVQVTAIQTASAKPAKASTPAATSAEKTSSNPTTSDSKGSESSTLPRKRIRIVP